MRKVMIIDDDVPMLRYLERMIEWESLHLQVVATAFSSVKALELFREKEPDIIITDIGMPQIDGIELAARVREINPAVRLIFVTCHEDFSYARSAMHLQADDYLIKYELTTEKLMGSLRKASKLADESRERIDQLSFREELERHKDQIKKQLWRQLSGKLDEQKVSQLLQKIGMRWELTRFMLAAGTIDYASLLEHYHYEDLDLIHYAFYNIAEETAGDWAPVLIIPQEQAGKFVFILNYKPNLAVNIRKEFETYLERLREKIKSYLKIEMRGIISGELNGLGAIKTAHEQLMEAQQALYYKEWTVSHLSDDAPSIWTVNDQEFKRYKDELLLANEKQDLNALEAVLERMEHYARTVVLKPQLYVYHLSQMLRSLDYEWNIQHDKEHLHALLPHIISSREALLLAKQHVGKLGRMQDRGGAMKEPRLHEINEYISTHLTENVSSVSVANHLYLNPSYFSRYFKKIAGINFTEYVHRYKMDIAKQLFEQGESVEMVAIKLGYSDRTYFSKVFKKYNGISPLDYKSNK